MVGTARLLIGICVLSVIGLSGLEAQDVRLKASVDSSDVRIGDWIRLRVTADFPASVESLSPMLRDSLGVFEVLRIYGGPEWEENGENHRTWNIRLTSFEPYDGVIPPVSFGYVVSGDSIPRAASTIPIPITVRGIEVDANAELKDVKPPVSPPWALEDFLPYGIFTLFLIAAGAIYYYFRKKRQQALQPEPVVSPIPPHERAFSSLRLLEDKRLWQQGKVKEYYSELTEIIRRFFEGRCGIIALEMTSDEIMQQLKPIPEAQAMWKDINLFFLTADLVKFAKYEPVPAENDKELQCAYEIVRAMVPKPVMEPEGEEVEADVR